MYVLFAIQLVLSFVDWLSTDIHTIIGQTQVLYNLCELFVPINIYFIYS